MEIAQFKILVLPHKKTSHNVRKDEKIVKIVTSTESLFAIKVSKSLFGNQSTKVITMTFSEIASKINSS